MKASVVFFLLLAFFSIPQARSAEPTVITLACDGTSADTSSLKTEPTNPRPKPIEKMGLVANLSQRTVSFMDFVVPISTVDAASIDFNGEILGEAAQIGKNAGYTSRVDGYIDLVTGHMAADTMTYQTKQQDKIYDPDTIVTKQHFDLLCKATVPVINSR